ncbi:acyltransferase family protein [Bradyrhizobium sp. NAS80.1]|uniref:acyltransferase family protein n=1 Tax=Bradyrhizobium sp. NAS80.1 TaxID=1680159 RepID=UPI000A6C76E1|nr:acyltransferase family protein [Bradyrhizobium sp. NAS80.1]
MAVWSRAAELADRTPASRNRYVDFLRATSMLVVTVGHWLAAAPYFDATNTLTTAHILTVAPWTAWLTWIVQVMPIFFMVGGYANGISWRAARRDDKSYAAWIEGRLRRLVWPILPLLAVWVAIVAIEYARGVRPELISYGSQVAFIPLWFLAVYIGIVLLVPVTEAAWARFGMRSFWALTAAAAAVDVMYFAVGLRWLGFANYLFVWGAISVLGYAWLDGRFSQRWTLLVGSAFGFAALLLLVHVGPYPVSMIGVPGDPISTTTPPKVTLIALATVQAGLLLAAQASARRWLAGRVAWTATVVMNGTIMTLFIWHLTATTLVVLAAYFAGGFGLRLEPGSSEWWWSRFPWLAANAMAVIPLVVAFGRFERPRATGGALAPAWRYVLGALVTGIGLALLAAQGVGGYGSFGLNVWGLTFALMGIGLIASRIGAVRGVV